MRILILFLLFSVLSNAEPPKDYHLKWQDEFKSKELDKTKWKYTYQQDRRGARYVPEAIKVGGGELSISTYTSDGITYSGSICTKDLFETSYGYWEIKAKFDDKAGTWSDAWLYSDTLISKWMKYDINNQGCEIDIFEHRSQDNEGNDLKEQINHALHYNGYDGIDSGCNGAIGKFSYTDDWHVFGFLNDPHSGYTFFVDGQITWQTKEGLTSRPQYLILSTEVESNLWSGQFPIEGYNNKTLTIQYVRFYSE